MLQPPQRALAPKSSWDFPIWLYANDVERILVHSTGALPDDVDREALLRCLNLCLLWYSDAIDSQPSQQRTKKRRLGLFIKALRRAAQFASSEGDHRRLLRMIQE